MTGIVGVWFLPAVYAAWAETIAAGAGAVAPVTMVPEVRDPVPVTEEPGVTPTILPAVPVMVVAVAALVTVVAAKTPKLEEAPRSTFVAAEDIDGSKMTLIPTRTASTSAERLKM
jgi:hypothetical protein